MSGKEVLESGGAPARWWLWGPGRETHFQEVADQIPALISLVTPEGNLEISNRHALEFFDTTLETLRCTSIAATLHPEDLPAAAGAWNASSRSGRPFEVDVRHRRADGAYRWFQIHGFPLRDDEGQIAFWYILERDTEDRKRAESLLLGEKRLLEMVAVGRPLPTILVELCLLLEQVASGCQCSVLLVDSGRDTLRVAAAPSLPGSYNHYMERCRAGPCGSAIALKSEMIVPDVEADYRWGEWRDAALKDGLRACWSFPLLSRAQQALGTLTVYRSHPASPSVFQRDVVHQLAHLASIALERAASDSALKQSETFLAKAQHLSSTGSYSWRPARDEICWSEELYRIWGLDRALPLTLERIASRVHPEDLPALNEVIEKARRGTSEVRYQNRLVMPDGTVKHIQFVAHGTINADGELEYIGAVQDVTERSRSEAALSKLRSELVRVSRVTSLGALAASIAHEVNQPLSGIVTNATTCLHLLAADPPDLDGARQTARRTIRDGNRAADVIQRLRALFTNKERSLEPVDLNAATREVIALSRSEFQRQSVILREDLQDGLPLVEGDRIQLQQLLMNLLVNASDAMSTVDGRPRQLFVKTETEEGGGVRVTVRDTGAGFDPRDADRLFDAFYSTKSEGMGIGLSVSRSIAETHGGRLWATPNVDEPGSTFTLVIPGRSGAEIGVSASDLPPATIPKADSQERTRTR